MPEEHGGVPNGAGKSALIDVLRAARSRPWSG